MIDAVVTELAKVPATLADEFRTDFYAAARRYTNWEVGAVNPFFPRWEALRSAIDRQRPNPFNDHTGLLDPLFGPSDGNAVLYAHCDLAQSHDSAGLAFAGVPKYTTIRLADGRTEIVPYIRVELLVRLTPSAGKDIDFRTIRSIIYEVRDRGFHVALVTYDRFQSAGEIQELNRSGIAAAQMSIDRTTHYWLIERRLIPGGRGAGLGRLVRRSTDKQWAAPFVAVRSACYEQRLSLPVYQEVDDATQWEKECRELAWHEQPGVVTKTPNSTDDLAQAVAGAVYNATMNSRYVAEREKEMAADSARRLPTEDLESADPLDAWERRYFGEDQQ